MKALNLKRNGLLTAVFVAVGCGGTAQPMQDQPGSGAGGEPSGGSPGSGGLGDSQAIGGGSEAGPQGDARAGRGGATGSSLDGGSSGGTNDAGERDELTMKDTGVRPVDSAKPAEDAGTPTLGCPDKALLNPWIASTFANVSVLTGAFTARTKVELPRLVRDATGSNAKYAFDLADIVAPMDPRVAFVNVRVTNLMSPDAFGAGIQTSGVPGAILFLSNVYVEPNWPNWRDYQTTNMDGIVLDGSAELYAENLTVKNWNADSALDIKSNRAQFVCLRTEGNGNRTLRFWKPGPHYLVNSSVNNETGAIVWASDCTAIKINVYGSTFNGFTRLPQDRISCDKGSNPEIVYLEKDPRATGDLHPMFTR